MTKMTLPRLLLICTLFTTFVTPSGAIFISPDKLNPLQPGVGTNRYAYSGGDPINRKDPEGTDWIFSDGEGGWQSSDGSNLNPTTGESTYDISEDAWGYTVTPGYSPAELPGVQTEDNEYGDGISPSVLSSGRTTVVTVEDRGISESVLNEPGGVGTLNVLDASRNVQSEQPEAEIARFALEIAVMAIGGPAYNAASSTVKAAAIATASRSFRAATGPRKAWVRLHESYSQVGRFKTETSFVWGSNARHRKKIGNKSLRSINQTIREIRIPGPGWRFQDPGHIHIKRKDPFAE